VERAGPAGLNAAAALVQGKPARIARGGADLLSLAPLPLKDANIRIIE